VVARRPACPRKSCWRTKGPTRVIRPRCSKSCSIWAATGCWPKERATTRPSPAHLNVNVNLQIAAAAIANVPEASETFYQWIEGLLPDSRKNAENIFGARGALFAVHPDEQQGALYHYRVQLAAPLLDFRRGLGLLVPSGITTSPPATRSSCAITSSQGLKELALFYEDFLKPTDAAGNFVFVPSYSPENWPMNTDAAPTVLNAVMTFRYARKSSRT